MQKLVDSYNIWLFVAKQKLKLVIEAEELASPKPRTLHKFGYNKIHKVAKSLSKTMTISGVLDTNSMEPVIDSGHLALIEDKPDKSDLIVGDIILFRRIDNLRVLHRIIEVGNDKSGWYCITLGDNVVVPDGKIRYKDILGICMGILY